MLEKNTWIGFMFVIQIYSHKISVSFKSGWEFHQLVWRVFSTCFSFFFFSPLVVVGGGQNSWFNASYYIPGCISWKVAWGSFNGRNGLLDLSNPGFTLNASANKNSKPCLLYDNYDHSGKGKANLLSDSFPPQIFILFILLARLCQFFVC